MNNIFKSERNFLLACTSEFDNSLLRHKNSKPILTVELYTKWYSLYIIYPNCEIKQINFPIIPNKTSFIDHCPNPIVVQKYAKQNNLHLDELAFELIVGRWILETTDLYSYDY